MAFAFGGALGTGQSKGTGNTVAITTVATAPAGSLVVVCIGVDNANQFTDDYGEVASVVDSAGNVYGKLVEYTNGQGGAGSGSTVSTWRCKLANQLSSGETITATLGANVGARAALAGCYTIDADDVVVVGSAVQANAGADPPAITLSGLPNRQYLGIGAHAYEGPHGAGSYAADGNYSAIADAGSSAFGIGTTGGGAVSNQSIGAGYRIFTGTGDSYDATIASNRDSAGLLVLLCEATGVETVAVAATADDGSWGTWYEAPNFNAATDEASIGYVFHDSVHDHMHFFTRFLLPAGPAEGDETLIATLTLRAKYGTGDTLDVRIYGVLEDDPDAPVSYADANGRTLTTAFVPWNRAGWTGGQDYQTPDLAPVLQELWDEGYGTGGKYVLLVVRDVHPDNSTSGAAIFNTRDASAEAGPRLMFAYLEAEGGEEPDYTLEAEAGIYALAGSDAGLFSARLLSAEGGSYTVTGSDAALLASRLLSAGAGAYALAGGDAALLAARLLQAEGGVYSLTGADAGLLASRLLEAAAGSYALTGADATLVYTPAGGPTYTLVAEAGSYTLGGGDAALLATRLLEGEAGAYVLAGSDAALLRRFVLDAEPGVYAVAGEEAALVVARLLTAEGSSYALTGAAASLVYSGAELPVTPETRIFVVPVEDRVFVIVAESRVYTVPAESRTLVVKE